MRSQSQSLALAQSLSFAISVALSACVAEGDPTPAEGCSDPVPSALFGADVAPDGGAARLASSLSDAVVGVYEDGELSCTGSVVAAGWVLTAAHCAATERADLELAFADGEPRVAVERVKLHESVDAALLGFDADAGSQSCIEPLPLDDGSATPAVGAEVWLTGRGLQETGARGALALLAERVVDVDATQLWVEGDGATGACVGDSGGPLLAFDAPLSARIVGVLHAGSTSCRARDGYLRADRLAAWVDATTHRAR